MSAPQTELDRFVSLFDRQVRHGWEFVEHVQPAAWLAVPVDSATMFLGSRVNRISIAALVRHLCIAEMHWFAELPKLPAGAMLPLPANTLALDEVEPGPDLIARYRESRLDSLATVRTWPALLLQKELVFVGRRFTVMGFLWAIHGHHGFHLGQIDLLVRQCGGLPPEYMEWPERDAIIA